MISLALPTYNGEKYLREQLDSIYSQTLVPDEVIVVDDCSTDGTVGILEEYRKKYGLKYYVNEKNLGYNKNFEKAIMLCSGDYIALSDQDDIWLPQKIEKSYKALKKFPQNEPSLVSSFGYVTDENKHITYDTHNTHHISGNWKLNFSLYASQGCTLMFNKALKDIVVPFKSDVIYDAYIGYTAAMLGNRYYIGENLMYYRIHSHNAFAKSVNQSKTEKFKTLLQAYVPGWFCIDRYKRLSKVRDLWKDKIPQDRLLYINNALSIYEVSPIKRICKIMGLREIPFLRRGKISCLLLIKALFRFKDIY